MNEQLALLYSYLHGVWQYRWSALVVSWVVALLGWSVVYVLPNTYTSYAVMHIDTKSIMRPLLEGLSVNSDVDHGLDIMKRRLLNRKNLEKIILKTDLKSKADDPQAMYQLTVQLAESLVLERADQGKQEKGADSVYALYFEGKSAKLVYQVVSASLESLIESTLESARTDTAGAQEFLGGQIKEYEERLSSAEQALADFKRENIDLMPDQTGGYYDRLQNEKRQLATIRTDLKLAERRLVEMQKQLKGESPILGGPQAARLQQYRKQLQTLLTQYTESHPDVKALRSTIADVIASKNVDQADIGAADSAEFNPVFQELKAEMHRTSVEVETMKARLAEKKASVEALKASVDVIPEVEAKLVKLNRDYDITRERYLSMVERKEAARLAQEVGETGSNINFRILNQPMMAGQPSGPDRLLLMSLVFVAALAAGLAWGFLKYSLQPTFIFLRQLDDEINLPVLGTIGLYLTTGHKIKRKLQITSFLMAFSLMVAAYIAVIYTVSGITIDDIYLLMQSSDL